MQFSHRFGIVVTVLLTMVLSSVTFAVAQTEPSGSPAATATPPVVTPKSRLELETAAFDLKNPVAVGIDMTGKKVAHRLPNYYRQLVSEEQKAAIYKIQDEFFPVITFLTLRLEKLKEEQTKRIQAVLTEKQLQEVEKLSKTPPLVP